MSVWEFVVVLKVTLLLLPLALRQPLVFSTKLRQHKQSFVINVLREKAFLSG